MPLAYLEQLFRNLRKAGIVKALRGPNGGYRLSRPSTEINISEVVQTWWFWSIYRNITLFQ